MKNTGNWENFEMGESGKGKKERERNPNVTNEERATEENDYDPEINEMVNEFSEERWDVHFTDIGDDPSSYLD